MRTANKHLVAALLAAVVTAPIYAEGGCAGHAKNGGSSGAGGKTTGFEKGAFQIVASCA